MKISIKPRILVIFLSVSLLAASQSKNRAYLDYIDQYHQLAERQQREHRIPASIILAQGCWNRERVKVLLPKNRTIISG